MTDICVKTFNEIEEAELFKDFLEGHGIDADIPAEVKNKSTIYSLSVDIKDKFEALKIVEEAFLE